MCLADVEKWTRNTFKQNKAKYHWYEESAANARFDLPSYLSSQSLIIITSHLEVKQADECGTHTHTRPNKSEHEQNILIKIKVYRRAIIIEMIRQKKLANKTELKANDLNVIDKAKK